MQTEHITDHVSGYLAFLADATPDFLASADPCTVLDARFSQLAELIGLAGYEWYAIDKQEPALIASRGITEPVGEPAASLTRPSPGAAIARQAIRSRQPILPGFERGNAEAQTSLAELGITDYACFPLRHRDRLLGAMSFVTRRSDGWGDEARLLLGIISQCCASALGTESPDTPDERPVLKAGQPPAPALTKLRSLAAQHTVTEEQARRQIARELEDHLSRPLALGRMKLGHVIRQTTTASISALLQDIDEVMDRAVKFSETFAGDLTPPVLHEQGFQPALHWLAARMEKEGLTVALRLPTKPPILNGNQAILLFHSVRELLHNVRKHAATKRASVTVAYEPTGHLLVSVEDTGQGFQPQEDLEAGEPHRRFGLFGIRERMAMLNGRMEIRSLPHQGTKVTLAVPAAAPVATEKAPNGHPTTAPRRRVLLVDDHAMVREGLRSILEGYQDLEVVGEAGDGIEAVKLARTRHPDVVVMDINMPRLDGIAATRQIKHDRPSTAVIGISIQESNQVEQAMMSAGATTFLRKDRAASHLHDAILHAK